jgi:uncharacterized OsmC-like protein
MAMTAQVEYKENLRTECVHLKSGTQIETDAPTDNNGNGERFSPTDLVATAFASCMMTIMGIAVRERNINIEGTICEVEKVMASNPRRISQINVKMIFPKEEQYSDKEKAIIEKAALTCPVHYSLHPDVQKNVVFDYS